jgi:hypothetical protein
LGSFTPDGGAFVHGKAGGNDQSTAPLKSTVPLKNLAAMKSTSLPENLARLKPTSLHRVGQLE